MAVPKLERDRVERAVAKFCDRVPESIQSKLAFEYRIRGNEVILLERWPCFDNKTQFTTLSFAKCVYNPRVGGWSLKCSDRNGRWHVYEGFDNVSNFRDLLREVEADPTGIFFG